MKIYRVSMSNKFMCCERFFVFLEDAERFLSSIPTTGTSPIPRLEEIEVEE